MPRVKTEEKSQAILDAAAKVFLAREFHAVLVDDVAAEAGIGKGTIYRYFPTKEELFFVSILHGIDGLYQSLAERPMREESPKHRLTAIAAALLRFVWNRRDLLTLLHRDEKLFARREAEFRRRRGKIVSLLSEIIAEGIARGEFQQIDPETGAEILLGMLRGLNINRRPADTPADLAALALEVYVNGVARRSDA